MSSASLASLVAAAGGSQPTALPATQLGAAVEAALGQIGAAVEAVALAEIGTAANMPAVPALPASAQPTNMATDKTTDLATVVQSLATAIVRGAAARQNGLAPLYSDLEAALARPDASLPQPVRAAADQLLGLRLDPGVAIHLDGNDIKTALAQAGLTAAADPNSNASTTAGSVDLKSVLLSLQDALKSWVDSAPAPTSTVEPAAASPSPAQPQPAQPQPAQPQPAAAPAAGAMPPYRNAPAMQQAPAAVTLAPDATPRSLAVDLLAATHAALATAPDGAAPQNGLAPLHADLAAALAQPGAELPPPVRAAAEQLLGLGLQPNPATAVNLESNNIKPALTQPGPAAAPDVNGDASSTTGSGDLESVLLSLQDALKDWVDGATTTAAPEPDAAPPLPASPQAAATAGATRAAVPMPPYRNAPTVAQAPAAVTLPPDAAPRDLALHLLAATDAALARHTLLQIASLPDGSPSGAARPDQPSTRATFDIPMVTTQGTGVAQFRIERDGRRRQGSDIRPVWRASFSIDLEPIGPVHASIALIGERATVMIHAERSDSAERLRGGLGLLLAGLREAALDPGDIHCRAGAPAAAPAAPGLFVDHAS